jgi:hypothetical protein
MKLKKEPPVFSMRQAAWDIVVLNMEDQLRHLPAYMADRATDIRRFLSFASSAREIFENAVTGITIESDGGHRYVDVWVSAVGRDRPLASIVLPASPFWVRAHERYLAALVPAPEPDEIESEDDPWL